MHLDDFQRRAAATAVYPAEFGQLCTVFGIASEAGEVMDCIKKHLRGDFDETLLLQRLQHELGDVLWYVAEAARVHGLSLDRIAAITLKRLESRQKRDQLKGDGDDR